VGKSEAWTPNTPESVSSAAAAKRQVLVRLLAFITFGFLFGSSLFFVSCLRLGHGGDRAGDYGRTSIFAVSAIWFLLPLQHEPVQMSTRKSDFLGTAFFRACWQQRRAPVPRSVKIKASSGRGNHYKNVPDSKHFKFSHNCSG